MQVLLMVLLVQCLEQNWWRRAENWKLSLCRQKKRSALQARRLFRWQERLPRNLRCLRRQPQK